MRDSVGVSSQLTLALGMRRRGLMKSGYNRVEYKHKTAIVMNAVRMVLVVQSAPPGRPSCWLTVNCVAEGNTVAGRRIVALTLAATSGTLSDAM